MANAREVRLLLVTSCVGDGTEDDPLRTLAELFTPDGQHVASLDPLEKHTRVGHDWYVPASEQAR